MSTVAQRLEEIRSQIHPFASNAVQNVTLVAVSKTKPDADLLEAYDAGQRDFGENRVQELAGKAERLPKDIRWHMIGHVQTNKIKDFLPFVHLVHGVDRVKVLDVMQKEAAKLGRQINLLLQVHIAEEATKFGFDPDELKTLASPKAWTGYPNLCPVGLMGMATFTDDTRQVGREFAGLRTLFEQHGAERGWDTLSMGMSGDWRIAVEEGSTMVRIGSAIFGAR